MLMLADLTWGQWFLAVLTTFACLLLILVVLLQKGRGDGLAGALGGGGGGGAFGTKTGDMFTWVTVTMAVVILLLCVVSNFAFDLSRGRPDDSGPAEKEDVGAKLIQTTPVDKSESAGSGVEAIPAPLPVTGDEPSKDVAEEGKVKGRDGDADEAATDDEVKQSAAPDTKVDEGDGGGTDNSK